MRLGDGSNNCGGESHDYQAGTAFDDELVKSYGIGSLDAAVHPYVVLGTCDVDVSRMVKPLSVVALVCGGELHYGVFGTEADAKSDDAGADCVCR